MISLFTDAGSKAEGVSRGLNHGVGLALERSKKSIFLMPNLQIREHECFELQYFLEL